MNRILLFICLLLPAISNGQYTRQTMGNTNGATINTVIGGLVPYRWERAPYSFTPYGLATDTVNNGIFWYNRSTKTMYFWNLLDSVSMSGGGGGGSTTITFAPPLTGGTISTTGTVSIPAATGSVNGYLTSSDWTAFNGKQAALGYVPVNKADSNAYSGYITLAYFNSHAFLDSSVLYTNYRADTSRTNIYGAIAGKQNTLGYTPENVANKATTLGSPNNTTYPTTALLNTVASELYDAITDSVGGRIKFTDTGTIVVTTSTLKDTALSLRVLGNSDPISFHKIDSNTNGNAVTRTFYFNNLPAGTDTSGLSNRINLKQNYADTNTYDGTKYNITVGIAPKQNFTDTNTYDATKYNLTVGLSAKMNYTDTIGLSNRINLKLNSSDTAGLSNRINLKLTATDTASLSTRINLKLTSTDTASLSNRINLKMNYTDTVGLSNRINLKLNSSDTAGLSGRINLKMNYTDTVGLSNRINLKLNSIDTAGLSGRINLKLNSSDTAGLSGRINLKQNFTDTNSYDGTKYNITVAIALLTQTLTATTATTLNMVSAVGNRTVSSNLTAQSGNCFVANPTGTFIDGETYFITAVCSTATVWTFGTNFSVDPALTTTSVSGKTTAIGIRYSQPLAKWQVLAFTTNLP